MKVLRKLLILSFLNTFAFVALVHAEDKQECADFAKDQCMVTLAWSSLTQWADAWSNQDYKSYISSYSETFLPPKGKSRSQWLSERKRALSGAAKIKISLHMLDVQYLNDQTARATVIQRYTAPHYSDIVLKTFGLGLQNGQVKIQSEQVDRSLTPSEADAIINDFGY